MGVGVSPGRLLVMEIAGADGRLIGWQSTRRQQFEDALSVLTDKYEERQGRPPGCGPATRWRARLPTRPARPSARSCCR
ncbi:hypothetical protein GCM10017752_00220 [Streptomyces roseoviridis]